MKYEDIDVPRPGPGEVQIKIAATGLNYLDVQYRIGRVKAPRNLWPRSPAPM